MKTLSRIWVWLARPAIHYDSTRFTPVPRPQVLEWDPDAELKGVLLEQKHYEA